MANNLDRICALLNSPTTRVLSVLSYQKHSRILVRCLAGVVSIFAVASAILAQTPSPESVLGPNSEVILSLIACLLAIIATLIGLAYRTLIGRLDTLENGHSQLCRVLLASTLALHPDKAEAIERMMRELIGRC